MIKYRIFSDYKSSAEHANDMYSIWNHSDDNFAENMTFVYDEDYTHAVIINDAMPDIKIDKNNVIGLSHEPCSIKNPQDWFVSSTCKEYYGHGQYKSGPTFLSAWVPPLELPNLVKGKVSIIVSYKKFLAGHAYRHSLVDALLQTDIDIHIYGNCDGWEDKRYKGPMQYKDEAIHGYSYHVVIENEVHEHWITEKLLDAYSSWSMPIYLGASFAKKAFNNCLVGLTGHIDKDMDIIREAIAKDVPYDKISKARDEIWRVGGKYNFPTYLYNFAREGTWAA
jgi:hypothetical protein